MKLFVNYMVHELWTQCDQREGAHFSIPILPASSTPIPQMTSHLPIAPPAQGMMCGSSALAMELQGIGRSRVHDDLEELEEPLDAAKTPATSRRWGSFDYDPEQGLYLLACDDLADFEAWHWEEELAYTIEILSSSRYYGGPTSLWTLCHVFVCGCEYPGGKSKYVRKCPDQCQKVPSKKSGCCFRLVIKFYLNMSIILGHIERDHDHEMGIPNLIHTRISHRAQARIKIMLRQKINPREIVHT